MTKKYAQGLWEKVITKAMKKVFLLSLLHKKKFPRMMSEYNQYSSQQMDSNNETSSVKRFITIIIVFLA
jgi:hypothetical protein